MLEAGILVAIVVAIFAVGLSTFAVLRTFIPPQTRQVRELQQRVEEVDDDNAALHSRLNERAARENMAKARTVRESRREHSDTLLEHAAALVKNGGAQPAAAARPTDPEAARAHYRAQLHRLPDAR